MWIHTSILRYSDSYLSLFSFFVFFCPSLSLCVFPLQTVNEVAGCVQIGRSSGSGQDISRTPSLPYLLDGADLNLTQTLLTADSNYTITVDPVDIFGTVNAGLSRTTYVLPAAPTINGGLEWCEWRLSCVLSSPSSLLSSSSFCSHLRCVVAESDCRILTVT